MVLGTAVAGLTCLADVTSANIVGYNSQTLKAEKYNLIALPFAGVAGGNSKLTECMSGEWFGGEYAEDGDNLRVWAFDEDGIGFYRIYYYYAEDPTNPGKGEWDGWYNESGSTYFDECEENIDGLEAGWCAWYQSRGTSAPKVTFSGAVESSEDAQFWIYGGKYNLIANPFPVSVKLNDEKAVNWGAVTGGYEATDGDNIRVWQFDENGIGYYAIYYYYAEDPAAPGAGEWDGWYNESGSSYYEEVADGIPAGTAFWYQSRAKDGNNHKITFFSPLAK